MIDVPVVIQAQECSGTQTSPSRGCGRREANINEQIVASYMPKKAPYGICHKCNQSVSIPGLEAFLCSGSCGWVFRPRADSSKKVAKTPEPALI
jgi:hypothetical protein